MSSPQSASTKTSVLSACEEVALHTSSMPRPITTNGTPGNSAPRVSKPPPFRSTSMKNSGKKYPTCGPATKSGCPVAERLAPTRSAFDIADGAAMRGAASGTGWKLPSSTATLPRAFAAGCSCRKVPGIETGASGSFAERRSANTCWPFAVPSFASSAESSIDRLTSEPPLAPKRAAISAAAAITSFGV